MAYQKPEEIISDEEIERVWGNANFGDIPKREVVKSGVLKYGCGYMTGYTANQILKELRLITKNDNLTTLGKHYLYASFSSDVSV